MPIDPTIPLMHRQEPQMSLGQMLNQVQQLRSAQQQHKWDELRQREAERSLKNRDLIYDVFRRNKGDIEKSIPEIMQIDPAIGQEWKSNYDKAWREQQDYWRKLNDEQWGREQKFTGAARLALQNLESLPDEDARAAAWPGLVKDLERTRQVLRIGDTPGRTLNENEKKYNPLENWPKEYDPNLVKALLSTAFGKTAEERAKDEEARREREKIRELAPNASIYDPLKPGGPGITYTAPDTPPEPGSIEGYFQQYGQEHGLPKNERGQYVLNTQQQEEARKKWNQSDDRPNAASMLREADQAGAEMIADAIEAGRQAPDMRGLYRHGPLVRSILAKRKYDLVEAQADWQAYQRWIQSANSTQQVRMRQAIDNAYHSLDVIEEAAKAWKGGNFPALNRARLAIAKGGNIGGSVKATIMGQDKTWTAAEIATVLEGQIADVTSELANVYMGGNSPTDHALGLASKNLNEEWSERTLLTALDLSRNNLKIRQNSMNVGPTGTGDNRYAPPVSVGDDQGLTPAAIAWLDKEVPPGKWKSADGKELGVPLFDADGKRLGVYTKRGGKYVRVGN